MKRFLQLTFTIAFVLCAMLSPLNLAADISANQNPEWLMFLEIGVLIAISFMIGRWQVIKHELV